MSALDRWAIEHAVIVLAAMAFTRDRLRSEPGADAFAGCELERAWHELRAAIDEVGVQPDGIEEYDAAVERSITPLYTESRRPPN